MKTDGISRLITALGRPQQAYQAQQNQPKVQQEAEQQARRAQNDDAVKISVGMAKEGATDKVRQEKIDTLKAQISEGSYNPSSEVVATAVIKELGI